MPSAAATVAAATKAFGRMNSPFSTSDVRSSGGPHPMPPGPPRLAQSSFGIFTCWWEKSRNESGPTRSGWATRDRVDQGAPCVRERCPYPWAEEPERGQPGQVEKMLDVRSQTEHAALPAKHAEMLAWGHVLE